MRTPHLEYNYGIKGIHICPISESGMGRLKPSLLGLKNYWGEEVWLDGFDEIRNGFTLTLVLS